MTILNTIILIVLAVETIYIAKTVVRDLNKVLRIHRLAKKFQAISVSVGRAKLFAEQGNHADCLRELDRACILITKTTVTYAKLIHQGSDHA